MPTPRLSLALVLLALASPGSGQGSLDKKVLFIGIDGLRPDAMEVASTPNIDTLIADGAYAPDAQSGPLTFSGPGWSNLLCGVWGDKHQVTTNGFGGNNLARYPNFLALLESALPDVDTATQLTWAPLRDYLMVGVDHVFFQDYTQGGDAAAALEAADRLTNHDPDAMFLYFADVDVAGHGCCFSPTSAAYLAEISETDGLIGGVLDALRARPSYAQEDWLILVSTDHGGIGTGHSGGLPEQRTIPFIVSGPSARKGRIWEPAVQADLVATAMAHLGVFADPFWELDGRPIGLALEARFGRNLIQNGDAEAATANLDFSPDRGLAGWRDIGALTAIEWDAGGGFPEASDPGPPARGASFFSGGAGTQDDVAHQAVDVEGLAHWIDLGVVQYQLEGWLGGYADQEDRMRLTLAFRDTVGGALGTDGIGPVTLADRIAAIGGSGTQLTGLLQRATSGVLPPGTRRLELELLAEHFAGGGTDGYGDGFSLVMSLDATFDCNGNGVPDATDIASGTSMDSDGNGVPDECDCTSSTFCATTPNTAGPGALLRHTGSIRVSNNAFSLRASQVPPNQFGIFLYGAGRGYLPLGDAFLCVGLPFFRLPVVQSTSQGLAIGAVDLTQPPQPAGRIEAGTTWHFQYWYRDPQAQGSDFNLSHGLTVTFCP
ncbi:MAG: sulfatase-like hydrolase/transferase [bacterium]|nr:sulfatase-like hydrolase/transferase [bacterium]